MTDKLLQISKLLIQRVKNVKITIFDAKVREASGHVDAITISEDPEAPMHIVLGLIEFAHEL